MKRRDLSMGGSFRMLAVSALLGGMLLSAVSLHAQETFVGKTPDSWAKQLKTASEAKDRRSAAYALGKMGRGAVYVLADMKTALGVEKDAKVRDTLVFALGEICRSSKEARGDRELETLFLKSLKDSSEYVRRSGAYALGCIATQTPAARAALESALDDRHAMVRQNAAWSLGQFGGAAIPGLRKALRDDDSLVKRDAAGSLLQIEDAEQVRKVVNDLHPLCRDPNSEVRRAALNVLVRIVDSTDQDAVPSLKHALDDRDAENRRNAALALTNIGGAAAKIALPVLIEATRDSDVELRRQAVIAIRNIGPAAAGVVQPLVRILESDKDAEVRRNAALALGGIGQASEPAIAALLKKIQDASEDPFTRIECAMALSRIGPVPGAVQIVPQLLQVLGDPRQDTRVRERVMWSLRVHGGNLRKMQGPLDTFTTLLKEPVGADNKMLRYDCAYMLGMIWQSTAPPATLDVLSEFLADDTIKLYQDTATGVEGIRSEGKGGKGSVKERAFGDGRMMATDALSKIGSARYGQRPDIMKQLRSLAADNTAFQPLQKKAIQLLQGK